MKHFIVLLNFGNQEPLKNIYHSKIEENKKIKIKYDFYFCNENPSTSERTIPRGRCEQKNDRKLQHNRLERALGLVGIPQGYWYTLVRR
jgi:hypothetical protein